MTEPNTQRTEQQLRSKIGALEELLKEYEDTALEKNNELQISRSRIQTILDTASDAIISIDEDQNILLFNKQASNIFGYEPYEVLGKPLSILLPERFRAIHQGHVRNFLSTDVKAQAMSQRPELCGLRKNGVEFPVLVTISKAEVSSKFISTAILRDITRQKELESQLLQAQKMENLGQLSASIAHDLNNQLTPVRGYLDMILSSVKPSDPNHPLLMEVNQAAIRSVEIVQRLLNFSKPSTTKKSLIKTKGLIEEVKKMLPQFLPSTVKTSVTVEEALWDVFGNETELQTVIINLIANARDAMPDSGSLALRAENAQAGSVTVSHNLLPTPYVVISIVDSGTGMTPEVMQRAFEPFYSTKGRAKGAGLGLSMAFIIVKAHDGWIDISSELGKGSAFQIYLPAFVEGAKPGGFLKPALADPALPKGEGLILFVDDEERLRTMGKCFLESLGYSVLLAKDGSDAVEKYVENQAKIAAVISDMTMPRMTGKQMLLEILGMNPKAVVILSSGYTDEGTRDDMIALGAADFFQKPYTIKILAQSLHQCLAKRTQHS